MSDKLKRAIQDLRYLLNKDYPRSSAVKFVADHYQLVLDDRHLLTRCVFSEDEVNDHRKRLIKPREVKGCNVGIDGYNVLITIESVMRGEKVVKCDDGFIRDLQAIFGKYRMSDSTEPAVFKILDILEDLKPEKVFFFFDKQVSKSGELAGFIRRELENRWLEGSARATEGTDAEVWDVDVSASSDRVIIERSDRVLDIPAEFVRRTGTNLLDLTNIANPVL